jgi:hypothetical protein
MKRDLSVMKFLRRNKEKAYLLSELMKVTNRTRAEVLEDLRYLMTKVKVVGVIDSDDRIVFMWRLKDGHHKLE